MEVDLIGKVYKESFFADMPKIVVVVASDIISLNQNDITETTNRKAI